MIKEKDTRWLYRFVKFNKVYKKLSLFLEKESFTEIEEQGLIKSFEYTFEFAWRTLQDLLVSDGFSHITDLKELIQRSYDQGYISDYSGWRKMIDARNLTYFTYDELNAEAMVKDIGTNYLRLFMELRNRLMVLKNNQK